MLQPAPSRYRAAFSLLELIILTGVVTAIVILFYSAVQRSVLKSKETQCLNNLKQWAVLFSIYLGENNNRFPLMQPFNNGVSWNNSQAPLLAPLQDKIDRAKWRQGASFNGCPAHRNDLLPNDPSISQRFYSYAYNVRLGDPKLGSYTPRVTAITRPNTVIMLADAADRGPGIIFYDERYLGFFHSGRCNALFVDGHIEPVATVLPRHCNPLLN